MLLSDGSVTRHLQLLTGFSVDVECMQMEHVGPAPPGLPPAAALLEGDLLQRQVRWGPGCQAVFYIVTGEPIKQSAELTGEPIKMKG